MDPERLSRARIRPARTEEELARAEKFLATPRVREIAEGHPDERGAIRLCEVDGELIAALLIDPSPLRLRGVKVRCARILETGGEDGRTHFRTTGNRDLFVLVLEEALGYVWIKRYPIAYVHGELALYPAHGFFPCFFHPRVYVPVKRALELTAPYRVRHLKADDVRRLEEMRSEGREWKPVVFAAGVPPFHHFCVENAQRELKGLFSLQVQPDSKWKPPLFAPEVEVKDRATAATVLRHCAEKAQELGLDQIHFPLGPGHPLARLCLELGGDSRLKGCASDPAKNEEMIHLVDPPRLVEELAPYFERRLARLAGLQGSVPAAAIPISTGAGAWVFHVDRGKVRLEPIEASPEVCLPIPNWAFTQLLTGYRGVDELDIDIPAQQASLLAALLPKTWPLSVPDPDVWDKREAPTPYTRKAAKVVAATRLPWAPGP